MMPCPADDSTQSENREYKIKAAFLYNFLKGIDWPAEVFSEPNCPIIIGVLGEDPFGKAFEPIQGKTVKGHKVVIQKFNGPSQIKSNPEDKAPLAGVDIDGIKKCNLLYICASEREYSKQIIDVISNCPVLTVGEAKGFIESGGIINFIPQTQKGVFDVNLAASEKAKLTISSKLLRIARNVVDEKSSVK